MVGLNHPRFTVRRFAPLMLLVLGTIWMAACGVQPQAPPEPDCSTPRRAADTLFLWQQDHAYDLSRASTCFEMRSGNDAERTAQQLKSILDAKGHWVPIATMSDSPDYVNDDGEAIVEPLGEIFPLVLSRGEDGQWRYTADTLSSVPRLYASTFSPWALWLQSQLPSVFFRNIGGYQPWQALFALLLFAAAWFSARILRYLLLVQAVRMVKPLGLRIDLDLYARTNFPLTMVASLAIVALGLPQLQLPIVASATLVVLTTIATRIFATVFAIRFIDVIEDLGRKWASGTTSKLDDQLLPLLGQAAKTTTFVIGGFFVFDAMGVDVWKLAAGVGIGGVALAFGAQDTVANVFGSINIFLDRPFQIGDWVAIGKVEGVVEEVGFRSTRVRTFYNSVVTVPNRTITNASVDNYGLRHRRRVKWTLSLTYDTPPERISAFVEAVRGILAATPGVEKTYEVHFHAMGPSSLDVLVYFHLIVPGWHEELTTRANCLMQFLRLADELGVSFAFPSTSLYLEATPEQPLKSSDPETLSALTKIVEKYGPGGAAITEGPPQIGVAYTAQQVTARGSADDEDGIEP